MDLKAVSATRSWRISTEFVEVLLDVDLEEEGLWMAIEGLPGSSWDLEDLEFFAEQLPPIIAEVKRLLSEKNSSGVEAELQALREEIAEVEPGSRAILTDRLNDLLRTLRLG